jgi:hypothetical protein
VKKRISSFAIKDTLKKISEISNYINYDWRLDKIEVDDLKSIESNLKNVLHEICKIKPA